MGHNKTAKLTCRDYENGKCNRRLKKTWDDKEQKTVWVPVNKCDPEKMKHCKNRHKGV